MALQDNAMNIRALLDEVGADNPEAGMILAARVEKVLALIKKDGKGAMTQRRFYASYHDALLDVERFLNGEE